MYSLLNIQIYDSANHISADIIASFLGLGPYLDPDFKSNTNAFPLFLLLFWKKDIYRLASQDGVDPSSGAWIL